MANETNKIEYSRLVLKRSTVPGVVPTIPVSDNIDNTWLQTDILIGECFINIADDKIWMRTDNGIVEIASSGVSSDNFYTDSSTLNGNVIEFFLNNNTSGAPDYTVDLTAIVGGSGSYVPLSGGTMTGKLNAHSLNIANVGDGTPIYNLGIDASGNVIQGTSGGGGVSGDYLPLTGGTMTGTIIGKHITAESMVVLNPGATVADVSDSSGNKIEAGVSGSAIGAGENNLIPTGLSNVFVAGSGLSATTSNTLYANSINIKTLSPSPSDFDMIRIIGLDVTGNVVEAKSDGIICDLSFAISDETSAITAATDVFSFNMPYAMTLSNVKVSLSSVGSDSSLFDVNVEGTSILSTKIEVETAEFSSAFALNQPVISTPFIPEDAKVTIDIDVAGTGAKGAKIYFIGYRS